MEIRYCQMQTKDGRDECGFLCGAKCRADPKNPFVVTGDFHDRLKIVGCQSWQRYMDYGERRERFGEDPDKKDGTDGRKEGKTECGSGRTLPVHEVSVQQALGLRWPNSRDQQQGKVSPSMRVLQEGCDAGHRDDSGVKQPTRCDLGTCGFCKEPAEVVDMGVRYCRIHAVKMGLKT